MVAVAQAISEAKRTLSRQNLKTRSRSKMVKPAPIVEAAVALEAKPRASPIADAPLSSSKVHVDAPTNSVSEL